MAKPDVVTGLDDSGIRGLLGTTPIGRVSTVGTVGPSMARRASTCHRGLHQIRYLVITNHKDPDTHQPRTAMSRRVTKPSSSAQSPFAQTVEVLAFGPDHRLLPTPMTDNTGGVRPSSRSFNRMRRGVTPVFVLNFATGKESNGRFGVRADLKRDVNQVRSRGRSHNCQNVNGLR